MPDTMKLYSTASAAAHPAIGLDMGSGISQGAADHPNSSFLLPASANTTQHDCRGANAAEEDKRWVGSLVCLATALTSASVLVWLTLIIAG